jgi:hypothetical protein
MVDSPASVHNIMKTGFDKHTVKHDSN